MTAYWSIHRYEIVAWVVVGVLLVVFFAWCYYNPKPITPVQPAAPVLRPRRYPDDHDVELAPLPRAFVPVPLYEDHERDRWMPDHIDLEKRADGYHYPKQPEEGRAAGRDSNQG